jgi:hypothetical protein
MLFDRGNIVPETPVYLTWADIKEKLLGMSAEELLENATIYDGLEDEFYAVKEWQVNVGDDVLHDGHAYMEF